MNRRKTNPAEKACRWFLALTAALGMGTAHGGERGRVLEVEESLTPYRGEISPGADYTTLRGKIMCGYQGWFTAADDGYERGNTHWGGVQDTPPRASVDLWPDTREFDADELYPTNFRHADGRTAEIFTSNNRKTVLRHFRWMRDYGIDGVFVQRFTSVIQDERRYRDVNAVLHHCREGANRYGRAFSVMYDTHFDRAAVDTMIKDWKRLYREMEITKTPAYMRHRGGPIVTFWGYGIGRRFDAGAAEELFRFVKDPANGGCTVMLGVANNWRDWKGEEMRLLEEYADVIQPWNVGRYGSDAGAEAHFARYFPGDIEWCRARDKDYYAVVFPGFSWTNLRHGQDPLGAIPRRGGRFFWRQLELVRQYGLDMAYVAMFDEVDEATAIFKCTNQPPVGRFLTYEGYPSDWYLRLAGLGRKLLNGEKVDFPGERPDPREEGYVPLSPMAFYRGGMKLPPDRAGRLKALYGGIKVGVIGVEETCSTWVHALTPEVFDAEYIPWETLEKKAPDAKEYPILVFGTGSEAFGPSPSGAREAAAGHLRSYVNGGGTLVVLSGGRYPMYRPGEGRYAEMVGLRVGFPPEPNRGGTISFSGEWPRKTAPWDYRRSLSSRMPRRGLYPPEVAYQALVSARLAEGYEGDPVAVIGPGGVYGRGRIITFSEVMSSHPDNVGQFAALMEMVARSVQP